MISEDVHELNLRICDYVTLCSKRDSADVIKVKEPERQNGKSQRLDVRRIPLTSASSEDGERGP